MWYPIERKTWTLLGILGVASVLAGAPAQGAVLDVCPTCTHTTLDAAFAAAAADDVIILDGPEHATAPTAVPVDYTLTTDLLINAAKDGVEIRGRTASRPDKIRIIGTGAGPVITVEEGFTFKALGVTITGGTTGVLAMKDSDVDIRRCLINAISGIGVNCTEPKEVYLAGSVITGCASDAVRLDLGGELNMTQCTLLSNTGWGVNAIAGVATVASSLIHDSGAGLDGTATSLKVGGNWVTDGAGAAQAMPTGVTDAFPITDLLDPLVTFEQDLLANPFPGDIDNAFVLPLTGQTAATLSDVVVLARDFSNVRRDSTDPRPGADENGIAVTAAAWIECNIVQRGAVRNWVSEGPATIYLVTENLSLVDSLLWVANPTQAGGITVDNTTTPNRLGPEIVNTPSAVDSNYGYVDVVFDRDEFVTGFPAIVNVDTTDYEIYIQPDTVLLNDTDVLDQLEAAGSPAEVGRVFGLDTQPPKVRLVGTLADQYTTATTNDGGLIDGGAPTGWGAGLIPARNVGANIGRLDGTTTVDPQVFFDGSMASFPPLVMNSMSFGVNAVFDDVGSGFATTGLPTAATASTDADRADLLYYAYENVPGMAWWSYNSESDAELILAPNAPTLTVNYTTPTPFVLDARWEFSGALYGTRQWHALANIRVSDMAGNEATLDPSFQTLIPLRPLHLWWLPMAQANMVDGPYNRSTTNPVFTWGLERNGGQEPRDPYPCSPSVQFYLFKLDGTGTLWMDICGAWSNWQNSANRTITLDSFYNDTTRLRDLIAAAGGQPNSQYLILLRGYDEAGNLQTLDLLGNPIPASPLGDLTAIPALAHSIWGDPGMSAAASLDTKVQPTFWHNVDGDRELDAGERSFGAASRVPLPAAPPASACSTRVEAGFKFTMQATESVTAAKVHFVLYEDGRLAARGVVTPGDSASGGIDLSVPHDFLAGSIPAWIGPDLDPDRDPLFLDNTLFLNPSADVFPCGITVDRLGDDGESGSESPFRRRNVKYQLVCRTVIQLPSGKFVYDPTPATVEFTVTVDRALKDDQPVKTFTKE